MDAINKALDAGIKASNLYEIATEDIIRRENLREFFEAALKAWLRAQVDAIEYNARAATHDAL